MNKIPLLTIPLLLVTLNAQATDLMNQVSELVPVAIGDAQPETEHSCKYSFDTEPYCIRVDEQGRMYIFQTDKHGNIIMENGKPKRYYQSTEPQEYYRD